MLSVAAASLPHQFVMSIKTTPGESGQGERRGTGVREAGREPAGHTACAPLTGAR